MQYLEGVDREALHKLWMMKQEAKRNGRKSVTILTILNAVLRESLEDMDTLRARFCTPVKEKE